MNSSSSESRLRSLLWLFACAAAASLLAYAATRYLNQVEASKPAQRTIARFRLEERNGLFHCRDTGLPFTGLMTDHYKDGTVKLRSTVVEGQLHGVSEGWFTNRSTEVREYFRRGVPHGTRTTWHDNGQKRSEGTLIAGLQDGTYRQWHPDGSLAVEAEFTKGKPDGLSLAWHPSGFLKAEARMKSGTIQARHTYPDGIRRESTLKSEVLMSLSIPRTQ